MPGFVLMAFPRARGWTGSGLADGCTVRGFPPCAGVDRRWLQTRSLTLGLSPVRGGGPTYAPSAISPAAAFPRARGWTAAHVRIGTDGGGFPPCAGVDRRSLRPSRPATWLSPVRGGGPDAGLMSETELIVAFPRARRVDRYPCDLFGRLYRLSPVRGGGS